MDTTKHYCNPPNHGKINNSIFEKSLEGEGMLVLGAVINHEHVCGGRVDPASSLEIAFFSGLLPFLQKPLTEATTNFI